MTGRKQLSRSRKGEIDTLSEPSEIRFVDEDQDVAAIVMNSSNEKRYATKDLAKSDNKLVPSHGEINEHKGLSVNDVNCQNLEGHVQSSSPSASAIEQQQPSCDKCKENEREIREIKENMATMNSLLNKLINERNDKDHENEGILSGRETELSSLICNNNKMATQLHTLEITVEEISEENAKLSDILGTQIKQWHTIVGSKNPTRMKAAESRQASVETSNTFELLEVEDVPYSETEDEGGKADETTSSATNKNQATKRNANKRVAQRRNTLQIPTNQKPKKADVLVLGDSMIKNIKTNKIARAAKAKAACKTYRGAKVEEIHNHFNNEWQEDEFDFHGVIIHAGTNNLAGETPEETAG